MSDSDSTTEPTTPEWSFDPALFDLGFQNGPIASADLMGFLLNPDASNATKVFDAKTGRNGNGYGNSGNSNGNYSDTSNNSDAQPKAYEQQPKADNKAEAKQSKADDFPKPNAELNYNDPKFSFAKYHRTMQMYLASEASEP